jgi:hypothetical protein
MKIGISNIPGLAALAVLTALGFCFAPAAAQTKPPESISRVKKVLLYNKIGGWTSVDGTGEVKAAFSKLAASKGFELVQSADDGSITLDYLKQFQVIVWRTSHARRTVSVSSRGWSFGRLRRARRRRPPPRPAPPQRDAHSTGEPFFLVNRAGPAYRPACTWRSTSG